jgi:hypothetical protein
MSGRSDTLLPSLREPGEHDVGLSHLNAAHRTFGKLLHWARTDFDSAGQRHDGIAALDPPQRPAVIEPAQPLGQAFHVVGKRPRRVELGDPLHQGVATDLDSPGGADRLAAVIEDARVIDVVRPRTDRAEVGEDIPDFLRLGRDGAATGNLDHRITVRAEKFDCGAMDD